MCEFRRQLPSLRRRCHGEFTEITVNRFSSRTYNASVTGETSQRLDVSQVILVENGWLGDLLIRMGMDGAVEIGVSDGAGGGVTGGSELRRGRGERRGDDEGAAGAEGVAVAAVSAVAADAWSESVEATAEGVVFGVGWVGGVEDSIAGWFREGLEGRVLTSSPMVRVCWLARIFRSSCRRGLRRVSAGRRRSKRAMAAMK